MIDPLDRIMQQLDPHGLLARAVETAKIEHLDFPLCTAKVSGERCTAAAVWAFTCPTHGVRDYGCEAHKQAVDRTWTVLRCRPCNAPVTPERVG